MSKIIICKNCAVHIERAVDTAKGLSDKCVCVYNECCNRQYLSNDITIKTCFHDFIDRMINLEHYKPKDLGLR